jgi:nicotinate-nucleotide pyrophosphorylase (carboxylating)
MGLYDMVMIKDNHIAAAGSVAAALEKVQSVKGKMRIEVECDTLDQVGEALKGGADLIMLDNMNFEQMAEAVKIVDGKVELEASGNVSLKTVADIAATGVDYISVGKLTHSVRAIDIGLDAVS